MGGGFTEQRKITLCDIWILTEEKNSVFFWLLIAGNKARNHYVN